MACIMGYTPEFFWRLEPAEFVTLFEAWKDREKLNDRRIARVCCVLANVNRNSKKQKKPFTEEDFMPVQKKKSTTPQTTEDMVNVVIALNRAFGGKGGV